MDCQCKSVKFWIGLGLGTVLGMVGYHFVKSEKAKEWKAKIGSAAQSAAEKAEEWMTGAQECTCKKEE